jgi:hypothetical protein
MLYSNKVIERAEFGLFPKHLTSKKPSHCVGQIITECTTNHPKHQVPALIKHGLDCMPFMVDKLL